MQAPVSSRVCRFTAAPGARVKGVGAKQVSFLLAPRGPPVPLAFQHLLASFSAFRVFFSIFWLFSGSFHVAHEALLAGGSENGQPSFIC